MTHKTLPVLAVLLGIIALTIIVKIDIFDFGTASNISPAVSSSESTFIPTEIFSGDIDGKFAVFEHKDFAHYRLTIDSVVATGELNTERGYASDADATVLVLNSQKPESDQMYFVRLSSDSTSITQLDSARILTPHKLFKTNAISSN